MISPSSVNFPIAGTHLENTDAQFNSIQLQYLISFIWIFIFHFYNFFLNFCISEFSVIK